MSDPENPSSWSGESVIATLRSERDTALAELAELRTGPVGYWTRENKELAGQLAQQRERAQTAETELAEVRRDLAQARADHDAAETDHENAEARAEAAEAKAERLEAALRLAERKLSGDDDLDRSTVVDECRAALTEEAGKPK